jgi:hypothetical protein
MKKFSILFLFLGLASCVYGPKDQGGSKLESLNGENYAATANIMGVPVLERKPVLRKIKGQVFCGEGIEQAVVSRAKVELLCACRSQRS